MHVPSSVVVIRFTYCINTIVCNVQWKETSNTYLGGCFKQKQNQDVLRVAFSNPEKAMGNSINEKELEDGGISDSRGICCT